MAFIILLLFNEQVYSVTPLLITFSSEMDKVVFDGKWSYTKEWKTSSLETLSYNDGMIIQLRYAHQDDFIYILVDAISDIHIDKGADRAMVCFDGYNDKTLKANEDDFCFSIVINRNNPVILQGGSLVGFNGNFKRIPNTFEAVGIGSVSDENDRYNKTPHASYEFKIPTKLIGRSSAYGFYLSVYDDSSRTAYSWPHGMENEYSFRIPSPSTWGELISLDKSLPEFNWPTLLLIPVIIFVVFLTRFKTMNSEKIVF